MRSKADFFKALADETRLKILSLLLAEDELCVCDIMRVLDISQSKASRHLGYLLHQGLVANRREGIWMYYRLDLHPGSLEEKQLKLINEMLGSQPEIKALREQLRRRRQVRAAHLRRGKAA